MNTMTRDEVLNYERTLRDLAHGYSADYTEVVDLAAVLGVETDYTELMFILSRAASLDDILARAIYADERHGDY